jgi:hypothetical protein
MKSNGSLFSNLKERKPMFDVDASCPHCDKKFKVDRIGLEAKEFIQCPHCRRVIKIDLADRGKNAIRMSPDFAD